MLNTTSINIYNEHVKKRLTAIQIIHKETLQEGGRCEEHGEAMLHALGKIQNEEFKL